VKYCLLRVWNKIISLIHLLTLFRQVVSVSAVAWFIRYIYYWIIQLQNKVIINKTKVLFPHDLVEALCLLSSKDFKIIWLSNLFYYEHTRWKLLQKRAIRTKCVCVCYYFLLCSCLQNLVEFVNLYIYIIPYKKLLFY
jgi:hypothetical protein